MFEEVYSPAFEKQEDRFEFRKAATSSTVAESVCEMYRSLNKLSKGVERMFLGSTLSTREADITFRMLKGLKSLVGSSEVMDESNWVCPIVWGTLAAT